MVCVCDVPVLFVLCVAAVSCASVSPVFRGADVRVPAALLSVVFMISPTHNSCRVSYACGSSTVVIITVSGRRSALVVEGRSRLSVSGVAPRPRFLPSRVSYFIPIT